MKKTIRIIIIATAITIAILLSCAYAMPVQAEAVTSTDYYCKLTIVTSSIRIEDSLWVISCEDGEGNEWQFLNDEELEKGDILNLLMFRLNEREENDECMDYMYEGHTDNINLFFQVMGWR